MYLVGDEGIFRVGLASYSVQFFFLGLFFKLNFYVNVTEFRIEGLNFTICRALFSYLFYKDKPLW